MHKIAYVGDVSAVCCVSCCGRELLLSGAVKQITRLKLQFDAWHRRHHTPTHPIQGVFSSDLLLFCCCSGSGSWVSIVDAAQQLEVWRCSVLDKSRVHGLRCLTHTSRSNGSSSDSHAASRSSSSRDLQRQADRELLLVAVFGACEVKVCSCIANTPSRLFNVIGDAYAFTALKAC